MDVTAVTIQQGNTQTSLALTLLKKNAQTEQALANMLIQNSPSGGRGQILDITV